MEDWPLTVNLHAWFISGRTIHCILKEALQYVVIDVKPSQNKDYIHLYCILKDNVASVAAVRKMPSNNRLHFETPATGSSRL